MVESVDVGGAADESFEQDQREHDIHTGDVHVVGVGEEYGRIQQLHTRDHFRQIQVAHL